MSSNSGISIDANVKNSTALNMEGKVSAMSLDLENQQINDVEEFNILDGKKLFYAITEAKASFTDIVDSWIENYVVEKEKALVSLIQLIICASNNKYTLNSSILGSLGMTEIYTSLTENFADEEIYPLISQQDSEFGANFYEFILKLAKASQHTFIDDDSIISDLLSFLRIASSSNYRPLRHTATFFGLSFATGMLSCLASLAAEICNTSSNGDVTLDSKAISQNDNNDRRILKARFDFLFKEIFALRYRDVSHEIRALCISELGNWMLIYPREIIKDSYLKYIGWLLYDKNSIVRLQCIKSILPMTNSKDSLELIQNFLKRFKERYVQMTHDVNDEVSLNALCSLLNISKLNTNYMDDSDYKHVIVLMTSVNRKISSMAASLALSLNSIKHKKSPKDSEVVSFIAFLCSCCAENTDLQSILLVIDSLNSFFDYSSRWDIYLEMINDSKYTSIDGLLLSVLHAAVCYFIGQNFPISRTEKKSIQSEVSKSLDENRNKFTSTFISNFAILFEKFFAESNQILLVVNMVQYFDIDFLMSTINNDEYVQEMAKMLQQLIEKSHSRILLLSSIRAVHRLTSDDLKSGTNTAIKANILNNVVGKILKSFTRSVHEFISGKNVSENLESMKQFTSSLSIFLKFFDLQEFEIEDILEILAGSLTLDDDRHIEIISNLFECQSNLMLIWINNYSLDKNKLMSQKESQAFINTKLDKVIHYLTQGKNILITRKFSHEIAKMIMLVIGTLFDGTTTPELVKDLSIQNAIQSIDLAILEYLQAKVFNTPTINSKEDNLKQEVLMAYCSLLMKQIFSLNHFKYILVHFSGHSIFNEIIKHVLGELKKYSPSLTCKIIHECFLDRFEECLNDLEVNNEFNRLSSGFIKLNELVKKILMNFGVNISKFKNILLLIQKMAIDYLVKNSDFDTSNQSVYAFFLELHAPLFKKMSNDDQKLLAMYFDQETKGKFENVSKTWPSVCKYFGIKQTEQQNALYQDEDSILEE